MLRVSNLNQFYGGSHILRDLSFDVPKGQVTSLLGRNGVGKTTLMKCLMGLIPAKSGTMEFSGRDITTSAPHTRVSMGIGYVPQGREIFSLLTVEENLLMGLASQPRGSRIPDLVFDLFPVLKSMLRRRGGDLSGGQQQQLAIGRALAMNPKILMLDEPTEGIQPSIIKDIGKANRQLLLLTANQPKNAKRSRTPSAESPIPAKWPSCWLSSITISPATWPTTTCSWSAVNSSCAAWAPTWTRTACVKPWRCDW